MSDDRPAGHDRPATSRLLAPNDPPTTSGLLASSGLPTTNDRPAVGHRIAPSGLPSADDRLAATMWRVTGRRCRDACRRRSSAAPGERRSRCPTRPPRPSPRRRRGADVRRHPSAGPVPVHDSGDRGARRDRNLRHPRRDAVRRNARHPRVPRPTTSRAGRNARGRPDGSRRPSDRPWRGARRRGAGRRGRRRLVPGRQTASHPHAVPRRYAVLRRWVARRWHDEVRHPVVSPKPGRRTARAPRRRGRRTARAPREPARRRRAAPRPSRFETSARPSPGAPHRGSHRVVPHRLSSHAGRHRYHLTPCRCWTPCRCARRVAIDLRRRATRCRRANGILRSRRRDLHLPATTRPTSDPLAGSRRPSAGPAPSPPACGHGTRDRRCSSVALLALCDVHHPRRRCLGRHTSSRLGVGADSVVSVPVRITADPVRRCGQPFSVPVRVSPSSGVVLVAEGWSCRVSRDRRDSSAARGHLKGPCRVFPRPKGLFSVVSVGLVMDGVGCWYVTDEWSRSRILCGGYF